MYLVVQTKVWLINLDFYRLTKFILHGYGRAVISRIVTLATLVYLAHLASYRLVDVCIDDCSLRSSNLPLLPQRRLIRVFFCLYVYTTLLMDTIRAVLRRALGSYSIRNTMHRWLRGWPRPSPLVTYKQTTSDLALIQRRPLLILVILSSRCCQLLGTIGSLVVLKAAKETEQSRLGLVLLQRDITYIGSR